MFILVDRCHSHLRFSTAPRAFFSCLLLLNLLKANQGTKMVFTAIWHGSGQHCCKINIPKLHPWKKMEDGIVKATLGDSTTKKANLTAARKERTKLPKYSDNATYKAYHISEFLKHPTGIEAVLNTKSLRAFQPLDANTYSFCRCSLPKIEFLNFEVAPSLDLRVIRTDEDCLVEMLSCKFEGSEIMERQNDHFAALMSNHMTWSEENGELYLDVDVKLKLTLEIYTYPFTMMPPLAVERPGNLMMQALVDRLVPLALEQLVQDYDKWVQEQLRDRP